MKKLIAVNDHIIVEVLQQIEEITEGGIVIPETVANKPQGYGKVKSTGSQVTIPVCVGDTIIFHRNAGMDIIMGKTILKVLKQPEVYAKLFDEEEPTA
jgi:co-chaperonin GroES (HSP10)